MTAWFAICHFLLVPRWNLASIFNSFQDICIQIYLGHVLELSRSHDVTSHVAIRYPGAISYRCSIVSEPVSPAIFKIMARKHIGVMTLSFQGHVTSLITWPLDSLYVISCRCPIGTKPLSSTTLKIFGLQNQCVRTQTDTPQVILYSVPCDVLHWTDNYTRTWQIVRGIFITALSRTCVQQ